MPKPTSKILSLMTPIIKADKPQPQAGGWLSSVPANVRNRKGQYAGLFSPVFSENGKAEAFGSSERFLTNSQVYEVYRRTPDVRAAVDSIVRRVATFDWYCEPAVSPHDDRYDDAVRAADMVTGFLSAPNMNGYTWQEVMTSFLTDVLIYDAGVLEIVKDSEGRLTELVPLKGSTIHPVIDEFGRIIRYEQDVNSDMGMVGSVGEPVIFSPDQILYLRVYSNSDSAEGNPIIEALVDDVITMMRSSQHIMLAMDADEIPPGLLVLAGVAGQAAKEARADLENLRGQDHKIRVLTTPDPTGVGAHWVELRHTPKDLEMREIVNDVRKTIWRCFGVMPVEMGETAMMPRATAQVQMDVASSHLVTPILELVQAKVNRMVIPPLIGADLSNLVSFKFDREARLSAEEGARRSEMHGKYVQMGMMTRNEVRTELGLMPIDGGDIPTVDTPNGPVPFEFFMQHPLVAPPPTPDAPEPDDSDPYDGEEEAVEEPGDDDMPPPSGDEVPELFKSAFSRAKYDGIDFSVPKAVKEELRRGLEWHEQGHSGDGLKSETVSWARRMANGADISPDKARKMRAWLARHEVDKKGKGFRPGEDGFPSPGRVAWALWGGNPAVPWSNKLVRQMEKEDEKRARRERFVIRSVHDFPSEWQAPSKYKDVRALNLPKLAGILLRYYDLVSPLWDSATAECVAIINARSRDGKFQPEFAESALKSIRNVIDRLSNEWSLITSQTYQEAAKVGVDAAQNFTGQQALRKPEEWASNYQEQAMRWLTGPDGPLVNIYLRVEKLIGGAEQQRSLANRAHPVDPLKVDIVDPDDATDSVVEIADDGAIITTAAATGGVARAWGANRWRINNWQGKLAYLANEALVEEMRAAGTAPGVGQVEWYVEWVANMDRRTCTTCRSEGDKGFRPLSSLTIQPGGDTECGARCRCVLVMWTKDEVDSGKAELFGAI